MNLSRLLDEQLLKNTKQLSSREREITLEVLHHLREVEKRNLFAVVGYSSLFEYAITELNYSAGAAHRRISSMRLLTELPAIEVQIRAGALSLSTVAQARSFFVREKTKPEEKLHVLKELEGKSARQVEAHLLSRSANPEPMTRDRARSVDEMHTELKVTIKTKVMDQIEELKDLMSTGRSKTAVADILSSAVDLLLRDKRKKFHPKVKNLTKVRLVPTSEVNGNLNSEDFKKPLVQNSRYISAEVRREVWHRDSGQCTFQSKHRKCSCKRSLQFDHIQPFANGGTNTAKNLRLRCSAHNQLSALQFFGRKHMEQFIPRIR